jgi:hypothetical protein
MDLESLLTAFTYSRIITNGQNCEHGKKKSNHVYKKPVVFVRALYVSVTEEVLAPWKYIWNLLGFDLPLWTPLSFEGCLTVHLPHEIIWNASFMQQGNFIDVFLARHVSGTYAHNPELRRSCVRCGYYRAPSALYTRHTQRLSRPPIQKLGAENSMLQLTI